MAILTPLSIQDKIVDENGKPTPFFHRLLQRLQLSGALTNNNGIITIANNGITDAMLADMPNHTVKGRNTAGTGDPENITVTQLLDWLSTTQGSIIYRDAASWTVLTPGTAGQVLQTQGAGANPVWATASGGGGPGYEGGPAGTVPSVGNFTWVNQGTTTAVNGTNGIVFDLASGDCNGTHRLMKAAAPSTPFDIYMRAEVIDLSSAGDTTSMQDEVNIILRDGVNGDLISLFMLRQRISGDEQQEYACGIDYWTNATTYSATPVYRIDNQPYIWSRVNVTSTTITFYVSRDGLNWVQVGTETIATRVGAVTEYGYSVLANTNASQCRAVISYFSTTAPSLAGNSGALSLIEKYTFTGSEGAGTGKTFSSLGAYSDLILCVSGRSAGAGAGSVEIQVNGLSTGIYDLQRQYALNTTNSADQTLGGTSINGWLALPGTSFAAGDVTGGEMEFIDYRGTTFNKFYKGQSRHPNSTTTHDGYVLHYTGQVRLTSAITSIKAFISGNNFAAGSIASLYGRS